MATDRKTDIGPPDYRNFMPPVIKNNYGKWKYHEIPKPGVMVHVAESGDKLYTVRAASPRLAGEAMWSRLAFRSGGGDWLLLMTGSIAKSRRKINPPYSSTIATPIPPPTQSVANARCERPPAIP